jgi:tetratricopeptide (TPR) repeat protein
VLLYEPLTGTTPLTRQRLKQMAFMETLRLIREEEPPRPSTRLSGSEVLPSIAANRRTEPTKLGKLVRGELDWIVMRALEKDRSRRYETANGLARDIERYLADEPVEACPPSAAYRLRKFARKNKKVLTTAAAFVGLLGVGIVVSTWQAVRATVAGQEARAAEVQALEDRNRARQAEAEARAQQQKTAAAEAATRQEADKAKTVNQFLVEDLLTQAEPGQNAPVDRVTLLEVLDRAADKVGGRFRDQPLLEASLRGTLGDVYHGLAEFAKAERHWSAALALRRRELGADDVETYRAMSKLGHVLMHLHQREESAGLLRPAATGLTRVLGDNHPDTLYANASLAYTYLNLRRPGEAIALCEQTLAKQKDPPGPDHFVTLNWLMDCLACAYKDAGRLDKARTQAEQTLEKTKAVLGPVHPRTLVSMSTLADVYLAAGQSDKALPWAKEALAKTKAKFGPGHQQTIRRTTDLARTYRAVGQLDMAVPLFEEALRLQKATLGLGHRDTLATLNILAEVYRRAGKNDRDIPAYRELLEGYRTAFGREDPRTLDTQGRLALMYLNHGLYDQAEILSFEAYDALRREHGPYHPAVARALFDLGNALLGQHMYASAELVLSECLATYELKWPDRWMRFYVQSLLGASLAGRQKYAEAEPLLLAAYKGLQRTPSVPPGRMQEALDRVARLYVDWGQPDKAAAWRAERRAERDKALRETGYIRDWLVLAPLPLPGPPATNPADQDPVGGEATLRPRMGEKVTAGGREVVWAEYHADDYFLDFNSVVGRLMRHSIAYAVCYVVADEDRRGLQIKVGSDDQAKVYLNGREVYRSGLVRSLGREAPVAGVTLNKGVNVLVFKVVNMGGDWQGCLRFVDKDDRPAKGLQVRLTPDLPPTAGDGSPPKP